MKIYLAGLFTGVCKKDWEEYQLKTKCFTKDILESFFYIKKDLKNIKKESLDVNLYR